MKRVYWGIAVLVLLGLSRGGSRANGWGIKVLDSLGNVGMYSSCGENGLIVYYDATNGCLKCTTWDGVQGKIDTTGNVGLYTSMSYSYVSYYDSTNGNLKCAKWNGNNWNIEKVDTVGDVGKYSSIKVDSFGLGYPHISYYDATNGDLKYASWDGSKWNIEIVDTVGNVGMYSSLIELGVGSYFTSCISYYDATNGDLKIAKKDTLNNWHHYTVDSIGDVGRYTSMSLGGTYYYDVTNRNLKYAEFSNPDSGWNIKLIDDIGDVGKYASTSTQEDYVVTYYDETNSSLKFESYSYGNYIVDSTGNVGVYPSLIFTDSGDILITYYDVTNGNLKGAKMHFNVEEKKQDIQAKIKSFPNPFFEKTFVEFRTPYNTETSLKVYNITGKLVKTLLNEKLNAGSYKIEWDGKDNQGNRIRKGIYFYKLETNELPVKIKKIVCL